jgi:hypothetical protein
MGEGGMYHPFRTGDVVAVHGGGREQAAVAFVTGGWAKLDRSVNGHDWYHFSEIVFVGRASPHLRAA